VTVETSQNKFTAMKSGSISLPATKKQQLGIDMKLVLEKILLRLQSYLMQNLLSAFAVSVSEHREV
jgi:hypothetical protein